MESRQYYMSLPYDTSGSRSKNRFRLELLWGVSKMIDLLETDADFTMVFDYACDIEVHLETGFDFFQIKTHGRNSSAYTAASLTKKSSKDAEGSILGKLYVLKDSENNCPVKVAVVSNVPYKSGTKKLDQPMVNFIDMPEKEQDKIKETLKDELGLSDISLENIFYICTGMNLEDPRHEILGKLTMCFQNLKGCEPSNPNALYRLIESTVSEKACYEYACKDYDEIVEKKGITRSEFNDILDCHTENAKTGIKQTRDYISGLGNPFAKRKYNVALAWLLNALSTTPIFRQKEAEIAAFLKEADELESMEATLDCLSEKFHDSFPIEIGNDVKTVFYIIIINRFAEGVYDNEDAV